MTVSDWLDSRAPAPPPALGARIREALGDAVVADAARVGDVCLAAAERLVGGLLAADCTSRDSALDLLTADALVTYAFEAAEQAPTDLAPRAAAAMRRIAELGVVP
jgi:hypothetical protein